MGRDPGAPDDKGKNKYLPPTDEIPVTTGHDLICLSGSSSSPGLSDNISGDCLNLDDSVLKEEWRFVDRKQELRQHDLIQQAIRQMVLCWKEHELRQQELWWEEELRWPEELRRQELREELREKLQEKLRWRELCREKLCWRELHQEELRRKGLLQKLRSECFVQGTSSASKDGNIEMGLGHTVRPPVPRVTMPDLSTATTLEHSQASDSCSSHDFAPTDSDIERGHTHSSDLVPSEQRSEDICSYHHAYERNWHRLATMVDPSLATIVQIACSLVAFKTSDGSSLVKDVLFYLLVIICVLGFLYTLVGKWFHCAKMAVIGLVATALGFLMTMALVVMYK